MGADNYTKAEKEFYESIMREIKMHHDFGERNPVDIGIECGYSENDVMKMIHMCQDIVEEEKMEAEEKKPEIPVREKWELEGIIPFEDFVKMDYPTSITHCHDKEITHMMLCAMGDEGLDLSWPDMNGFLMHSKAMKKDTLKTITDDNKLISEDIVSGARDVVKWMTCYGIVYNGVRQNMSADDIAAQNMLLTGVDTVKCIMKVIEMEKKNTFHPIDLLVLKQNGWDKEMESASDDHEEVKKGL